VSSDEIPFNWPHLTGKEVQYIEQAHRNGILAGDGPFTKSCNHWIEQRTGCVKAMITHSCTAALEMSALLLDIAPGDEVIMPSYTFVSTANAFVLRGAVPVFVDIRPDTLNLNEGLIEDAITEQTRVIVPVHYAGVACDMDEIIQVARRHGLSVVEDAAQGMMASYRGHALGTIGDLGAYSFHETKNVISGEGGCLVVNRPDLVQRAEIIREKGTDRSRFFRGEVDKYSWQDIGSSFLPGELTAAFLLAQLEQAENITATRMGLWNNYHALLARLESAGAIRRPIVPDDCQHNAHMYYVLLSPDIDRSIVLETFGRRGIFPVFHYVPLHSSIAGRRYGRVHGSMEVTDNVAERLLRLPMWIGLTIAQQQAVVDVLQQAISGNRK
jgi:dTDP-4-amino-4,6-dideoxygalactose transaminase